MTEWSPISTVVFMIPLRPTAMTSIPYMAYYSDTHILTLLRSFSICVSQRRYHDHIVVD